MYRKINVIFLAAALILLCGCVDISHRDGPEKPVMATTEKETDETTVIPDEPVTVSIETTVSESSQTLTDETVDAPEMNEIYSEFTFSDEYYEFLNSCVFVGDSICSGLGHYGIIPMERVIAQGNIAARNILDFTFPVDGGNLSLVSALVNADPEYIVFSMGINDVNITTEQEFTDNYREILQMTEGFLPNAKLIILSITPVDKSSTFTSNERIDSFNDALSRLPEENSRWQYIDVTPELKNDENALKTAYSSGDGIHLSPDAYHAALYQLCSGYLAEDTEESATDNAESEDDELTIE